MTAFKVFTFDSGTGTWRSQILRTREGQTIAARMVEEFGENWAKWNRIEL